MKVFITIPWFLPGYKAGGPIRSVSGLINEYEDAKFFVFTGNKDVDGSEYKSGVVLAHWIKWNERTQVFYSSGEKIKKHLREQIRAVQPDVLLIIGVFSWRYNLIPVLFSKVKRKILSTRGMLHYDALQQKSIKKKMFLLFFKAFGLHKKVIFHVTNKEEERYAKEVMGDKIKVVIASNFPNMIPPAPMPAKVPGALRMTSLCLISPMKNILRILKALESVSGHVIYHIYGAIKDKEYWHQCTETIDTLPENVEVKYMGELLPDLIPRALAENHVFILPSKSENFGHALFEALSAGRPVITSHNTPFKELQQKQIGINVSPGQLKEIGAAINTFIGMDEEELAEWSAAAHAYAVGRYDREDLITEYDQLFYGIK